MKVKEIDRTANIAWSPHSHHPIYLAAGTAAQQLDATFSTTAALEIYDLNLNEPGLDMCLRGSIVSDFRFHKIVWGCNGMKTNKSSGILVGGADGGNMLMYDPAKLITGEDALLYHKTNHSGPVSSLDFNKFQECLLASGSSDSEIFIWDLNNPSSPMTPGTKSQPTEDVTSVAWNCQVQHILASTFPARCVVWDLRKNEPIIKVSDSTFRMRCKMVAWHPEVATQLCLASDDDHCPLIQLWDLRFATAPVRSLEQHQKGVLAIAWCSQDPDLLLSCGKDRILCWNPNSSVEHGELICELPTSNQWSFDVAWCPRNPAVVASSSCDGHVCAHSLMGGQSQQIHCSSKIAESFPGSEMIMQPQISAISQMQKHVVSLRKPPKWLRRPVGASFSFGGRLVSFCRDSSSQVSAGSIGGNLFVYISQVVTEPKLLNKAFELETALTNGKLAEFCHLKAETCSDDYEKMRWSFLEATFAPSPRAKMLTLLGYDYQSVHAESTVTENASKVSFADRSDTHTNSRDLNEEITKLSLHETSPHSSDHADFVDISEQSQNLQTQAERDTDEKSFPIIVNGGDVSTLVNRALITGNVELAVELCLSDNRWADALILAQAGGYELLQKTQKLYFKSVVTSSSKLISAVATSDWSSIIKNCELASWKEGLAAILTYAKPEEFADLCEMLGSRLENEKDCAFMPNAALCYISSGNLERLAKFWIETNENFNNIVSLECLTEQLMVLHQAVKQLSGSSILGSNTVVSLILGKFAELLASQGNLKSALLYLLDSKEKSLAILRDRICQGLGLPTPYFPFELANVPRDQTFSDGLPQEQRQSFSFSKRSSQGSISKETQQPSFYSLHQHPQQFQASNVLQTLPSASHLSYDHPSTVPQFQMVTTASTQQAATQPLVPPPSSMSVSAQVASSVPPPPADIPNLYGGKSSSGHTLSQRYPKHLQDPSIYSESSFPTQQPQQYYNSQTYATSQLQQSSYYSTEQSMTPAYSKNSSMPSYPSTYSAYTPHASSIGHSDPVLTASSMPPSSTFAEIKTGWNDPPLLKPVSSGSSHIHQTQSAITAPLPNVPVPEIVQPTPSILPVSNSYYNPPYAMQVQALPVSRGTEPLLSGQKSVAASEIAKETLPIPQEHQVIQKTLEDLRQRCVQASSNPQTRRKLEDVSKKLDTLYDKLRERCLSSPVEDGLHQIVQSIAHRDYNAAISVQGMLVSSANFSEISGFMPSIKVLLQTAVQNGVYLS